MKRWPLFMVLAILSLIGVACSSDDDMGGSGVNNTGICDNVTPRFAADVQPIISATCALSGCHVAGFGSGDFRTYDGIKNRASSIRAQVISKSMPPSNSSGPKTLSDDQIKTIRCWVDNGAPNN